MATFERPQVVIQRLVSDVTGNSMTNKSVEVLKTATMSQGSALLADGTEATLAQVALVTGVIDDLSIDNVVDGDSVYLSVAESFCLFKTDNIHFSDAGAFVPASASLLNVLNKFQ